MKETCLNCGTDSEGDTCPVCHKYGTEEYAMDDSKPPRVIALEKELAEAEKNAFAYKTALELSEEELAEARAEIERLRLELLQDTEKVKAFADQKNALIEQMREALRLALQSADAEWENQDLGHDWPEACKSMRAALEAAERGEK